MRAQRSFAKAMTSSDGSVHTHQTQDIACAEEYSPPSADPSSVCPAGPAIQATKGSVSIFVPFPNLKMLSESTSTRAEEAAGRGRRLYKGLRRAVNSLICSALLHQAKMNSLSAETVTYPDLRASACCFGFLQPLLLPSKTGNNVWLHGP